MANDSTRPSQASPNVAAKAADAKTVFFWQFLKLNLMAAALLWLVVYRLSETAEKLPEFVYVNF
jgi:hypothetical protein